MRKNEPIVVIRYVALIINAMNCVLSLTIIVVKATAVKFTAAQFTAAQVAEIVRWVFEEGQGKGAPFARRYAGETYASRF